MNFKRLRVGDCGDEVRRLHNRLLAHGLEIAPGERKRGYFGPSTRAVIGNFQRATGIHFSCEACEKTIEALTPAVGEVPITKAITEWPSQAQQATATTPTGRNLILSPGTGTTMAEAVNVQTGGVDRLTLTPSNVSIAPTLIARTVNANCKVWEDYTAFQTTDATQSVAYAFNLVNNAATHLDVLVTAINSDKTAGGSFKRSADFRKNDGTAAQINAIQHGGSNLAAGLVWSVTIDLSESSVRVLVTGAAGTTIRWGVYVSVMETTA